MANNVGTSQYDYRGMADGMILTANDGGTSIYDMRGMAEAAIGTSTVVTTTTPLRSLMGVGI